MTAATLSQLIGQCGLWHPQSWPVGVSVRILDARSHFGRVDCLITPIAGKGEAWVGRDSLTFIPSPGTDLT